MLHRRVLWVFNIDSYLICVEDLRKEHCHLWWVFSPLCKFNSQNIFCSSELIRVESIRTLLPTMTKFTFSPLSKRIDYTSVHRVIWDLGIRHKHQVKYPLKIILKIFTTRWQRYLSYIRSLFEKLIPPMWSFTGNFDSITKFTLH